MSFSFNIMGTPGGSVIANTEKSLFLSALNILKTEGYTVDATCLKDTAYKIYNPFNKTPNRLEPIAYEILNAQGVDVKVECLSVTTKNLTNE